MQHKIETEKKLEIFNNLAEHFDKLESLLQEQPGKLTPKKVHKIRVTCRRIRGGINNIEGGSGDKSEKICKNIKKFAGFFGDVRDLDVQIKFIKKYAKNLSDDDFAVSRGISKVRKILKKRRKALAKRTAGKVEKKIKKGFLSDIVCLIEKRELDKIFNIESVLNADQVKTRISARVYKVLSRQECLLWPHDARAIHKMRIALKKLRYCLEIYLPLHPRKYKAFIDSLKNLQDITGLIHDLDQWPPLLQEIETESKDEQVCLAIDHFRRHIEDLRMKKFQEFVDKWEEYRKEDFFESIRQF
jgi:CHAD domain-containing protein